MKKVLVFGLSSNIGGVENVFDEFFDTFDKNEYHFDFVAREEKLAYQNKYDGYGSKTYVLPSFIKKPFQYYREIKKIISSNKYDVIYINLLSDANFLTLLAAKKDKKANIILHAHNNNTSGVMRKFLHLFGKIIAKQNRFIKIACSNESGQYMFGRKPFTLINNPFDPRKFRYSEKKRAEIRKKYNIPNNCTLLGVAGRLAPQKNPQFILRLMKALRNNGRQDIRVMFVGDGKYKELLLKKAEKYNISNRIIITGNVENSRDYYSAMDLFLMPSKYEGLGIVGLEAQASGLNCVFSDNVPSEVNLFNDNITEKTKVKEWVKAINRLLPLKNDRKQVDFKKFSPRFEVEGNFELLKKTFVAGKNSSGIDFVIMWVDPNDPKWQKEKNKYTPKKNTDSSIRRYRDWDNLQYWFRGVEKYAQWVDNIYFVTYGHIPKWLNTRHPKLKIIKHSDFIPNEYLPTFSANPIEMNLHRIKGLSEKFVFFNDDFFIINKTKPSDFFKNNVPRDSACMYINIPSGNVVDGLFDNDMQIINKHFSARKVISRHPFKWFNIKNGKYLYNNIFLSIYSKFVGIHFSHLPASFTKSCYQDIWNKEYIKLDETCRNRFRSIEDVNQWLIKYWQICEGKFSPRKVSWGKYYEYGMGYDVLEQTIKSKKFKAICVNDTVSEDDFETAKNITNKLFDMKFPGKSEYER